MPLDVRRDPDRWQLNPFRSGHPAAGKLIGLGDDQDDRLMTSDEPDLVRGYMHGHGSPPVALIDRCQEEGRQIFHGVILAHGRMGNR